MDGLICLLNQASVALAEENQRIGVLPDEIKALRLKTYGVHYASN